MVMLVPSMCNTLTMLSPLRVSSAVLPSCRNPMPLGSDDLLPVSSLPAGVSRLSFTANIDTVPSQSADSRIALRAKQTNRIHHGRGTLDLVLSSAG
jgi:hypothetical protein